ncbi:transmembrane signal receptor [Lithospermum erythrorhizon]|uniref:Transmembrane signal receptor n=1 Tax=Lithospermum erythrorhizon TaxID=34254 RepID=A0AAV3QCG6_LITER
MLVYVDDILVTGNSVRAVDDFIRALSARFVTRDLGDLSFFLGIEAISQANGGLLLSQRQYMLDLLVKANMEHCKPASTPMSTSSTEGDSAAAPPDPTVYRQLVGSLQYLTLSRPDISYAVNRVCQHMHAPDASHFLLVKRILRYVKATLHLGLLLLPSPNMSIQAFSDADWAGSSSDRRSTGGYAVYLSPNLISWQSKKQRTVARSSTGSEYKALANCSAEISWLTSLFTNPVFHAQTKHIEIDFHFFISTKDQITDLTKPLSSSLFAFFGDKLRLCSRPPSTCEGSIR